MTVLSKTKVTDARRLELLAEAVRYCQRVKTMGMPASAYTKALREPVYFLWERRAGKKEECARYRSKAAQGMTLKNRELVYDHAVPFVYLQRELLSLDPVTESSIAEVLEKYGTVALITKSEDDLLNAGGYNRKMPEGWDKKDPLARYKAVGIELVENSRFGNPGPAQIKI